ncbi:MAG: hypothetical protein MJ100_07875 [Ruminococcus sp.]|nr:hypothetical protein [Ruminococcus sp.]
MDDYIEVKVHSFDIVNGLILSFFIFSCFFTFCLWLTYQSVSMGVWFVILGVLSCFYVYLYAFRPIVIKSDGNKLCWKHLKKVHTVYLADIKEIVCEPYEWRGKNSSMQRIRLTFTAGGNYYEFNDDVKSAELLNEKISGNPADVPLIQLYNFLKEHCKNYSET